MMRFEALWRRLRDWSLTDDASNFSWGAAFAGVLGAIALVCVLEALTPVR